VDALWRRPQTGSQNGQPLRITAVVNAVGSVNRGNADSVLRAKQVQKGLKIYFS
jgi:hypothetical protein